MFSEFQVEALRIIEFWGSRFDGVSAMLKTVQKIDDIDVTLAFGRLLKNLFETNGVHMSDVAGDDVFDEGCPSSVAVREMLTPDREMFTRVLKAELDIDIVTYISYYSYYNSNQAIFAELVDLIARLVSEDK